MIVASDIRIIRVALFGLALVLSSSRSLAQPATPSEKAPPAPVKLQLKNGQSIRVTLGYRRQHEPASGIRPDKGPVWTVIARNDLTGSSAELVDLTPDAPRSRWQVEVQGDKLVLDSRRFVPSHVYQMDVRKERKLVGSVLLYLYPPPAGDGTDKVDFKDEEAAGKKDESSGKKTDSDTGSEPDGLGLARVPKGEL